MTTESRTLWFFDTLVKVRISNRDGAGTSVLDLTAPHGSMPPLHVHDEDESFYVGEGRITFYVGDEVVPLHAGSWLRAPKGVPHTYRVESHTASMLVLTSPGRFEDFVRALSMPVAGPALPPPRHLPSPEEAALIAAIAAEHGIAILGPPGMLPAELRAAA